MCRTRCAAKPSTSRRSPGHPDRRRLLKVEAASAERIAPFCPHFGVCGGCAIQHWDAEPYRAWKRELVVTTLAQAGIDCDVAAAGRCPWRRPPPHHAARADGHARGAQGRLCGGGFARHHSDRPLPDPRPALDGAIEAAWAIAEPLIAIGKPLDIQITATNSGLDVDVRGSGPLSTALDHDAVAHRRTAPAGAADAPRRTGADANAAGRSRSAPRRWRCRPARSCRRRWPARKRWPRWCSEHCKRGKTHRRPVLRRRPLRAAAGGEVAGHRLRQRRRRGRRRCRRPRPRPRD